MNNLVTRPDIRDWKLGDGNIQLKGGNPDWTGNYWFKELQKINGFETDCCVIFGAQESFDAQMDRLIQAGGVSESLLSWFTLNGYMDSSDGKPHFHTSERYTAFNTGNGYTGNAGQDPWVAMRTYGCIPWSDWAFDSTITQKTYFDKPPQYLYDKGALFLSMIGGKNSIQYHWIYQGSNCPRALMDSARPTAPLCLGVTTNSGWNQEFPTPPSVGSIPNHMVDNISNSPSGEVVYDHYVPFTKTFGLTYPIPQVIQGVLTLSVPVPTPPAPVPTPTIPPLPPNPTPPQIQSWLSQIVIWLQNIIKGRQNLTSMNKLKAYDLSPWEQSLLDIAIKIGVFAGLIIIDAVTSSLSNGVYQLPDPALTLPIATLILSQLDSIFIAWSKTYDVPLPPPAPTN